MNGLKEKEKTEYKISINNVNLVLKFAEKPSSTTQDQVMGILIDSYKSRIMAQKSPA